MEGRSSRRGVLVLMIIIELRSIVGRLTPGSSAAPPEALRYQDPAEHDNSRATLTNTKERRVVSAAAIC
jgi:hypothetical protein